MRTSSCFLLLSLGTILLFVLDLMTGDSMLSPGQVWAALTGVGGDELTSHIVLSVRLVRAVVAVLVGMALSVSGLQMQTVFRNPLADPYLLGVSSGAGLGVALFILGVPLLGLAGQPWLQSVGIVGAGWLGAAGVLLGVAVITQKMKNILGVLILGVMIGYVAGALIQILQYLSSAEQLKLFTLWSLGSLGQVTVAKLQVMWPVVLLGIGMAVSSIKALNLLLLGDNYAATMGLDIRRARTRIFLSTMLLTGTVTAFCGPVGFIGLAIPHLARLLFGQADHRVLLPASIGIGMAAMLVCDIVSKTFVLPVNCIAALLGVPVIIWVVVKNMNVV